MFSTISLDIASKFWAPLLEPLKISFLNLLRLTEPSYNISVRSRFENFSPKSGAKSRYPPIIMIFKKLLDDFFIFLTKYFKILYLVIENFETRSFEI